MCLAVPGRIVGITGNDELSRTGRVSFAGIVKPVSLAFVPEARVNDFVLVHVGVALSVLDEREAAEALSYLAALGEIDDPATSPGPPR